MAYERTQLVTPAVASATAVHAAVTLTTSAQTVTTGITNPVTYRAVSVTGNQASVTGNVVVTGTDWNGGTITDTIALSGASTVAGVRAFKTVTSIALPVLAVAGDTVSVGIADVFGLYGSITAEADVLLQEVAATAAVEFTITATGTVNTTYDTVATAVVAGDRIRWTYLDSASTSASAVLFSVAEARAFDQLQLADVSTYPDATIEACEARIRDEFADILSVQPVPTVTTEYVSGDGSSSIMLAYPEVTAVSAVSTIDSAGTTTAFTATELADVVVYPWGLLSRRGGSAFDSGSRNVVVTYTSGWASVPADIKRAALMVALQQLVPSNIYDQATNYQAGDQSYTFSTPGRPGSWYGIPLVDGVLDRRKRKLPGVA